jgi:hypothetical protein
VEHFGWLWNCLYWLSDDHTLAIVGITFL